MTTDAERTRILVVDAEQTVADCYARWLADEYDVRTAYSGEDALGSMADHEADVVVLDRRMAALSGDGVAHRLDQNRCNAQVIMVTAVPLSPEMAALPIDDYINKPIKKERLRRIVETAALVKTYDENIRQLLTLTARRQALEEEVPADQLEASEAFGRLVTRIENRQDSIDNTMEKLWSQLATDLFARIEGVSAGSQITAVSR